MHEGGLIHPIRHYLPFWPECLQIKFQKIYLCKATFLHIRNSVLKNENLQCNVLPAANKFSRIEICNFVDGPKSNVLVEVHIPRSIL